MTKQWYEEYFDNFGRGYDNEEFTHGTVGEVDFIEREIGGDKTKRILDIGCGTGRHAVELAKRGYAVTGIDLSESLLKRAGEKAAEAKVTVDFRRADARNLAFNDQFDLALLICEAAFPLMETDEMNFQILQSAARALRPGGKLILTTLNALFPLFHSVKDFLQENDMDSSEHSFDLMTFRDRSTMKMTDDSGAEKVLKCDERYYTPPELTWLLKSLGFNEVGIYGCKLGAFSRADPLTTEDFEMLVIAGGAAP